MVRSSLEPAGQVSNSLGGTTINGRPVCETGGSTCVFARGDERQGLGRGAQMCPRRAFETGSVPATSGGHGAYSGGVLDA